MKPANKKIILELEKKHMPVLFDHCRALFAGHHLPSHDHLHHLRVWYYTRELLLEEPYIFEHLSSKEIMLLMLSVFFHDTGLTITLSENHGVESRKICQNFLSENPEMFFPDVNQALNAIEFHDQKEPEMPAITSSKTDILKLLSICDDLDAYGAIGILRYAEIYLLRGISYTSLPGRVIKNLSSRFNHISSQHWIPKMFLAKHESRYQYAIKFYQEMEKQQIAKDKSQINSQILESYMNDVYYGKKGIMDYAGSIRNDDDPVKKEFASVLLNDLKQNHGQGEILPNNL